MNLYKALSVCTVAGTLSTLPSTTLGFVPASPVSFALDSMTKNNFVAAVATNDRASMAKPLCMVKFSKDEGSYPKDMSPEEELDFLRQVAEDIYAGQDDVPDIDEIMKVIAEAQSRPEPDPKDMDEVVNYEDGILAVPCEVAIVIDVVSLALEVVGAPGGGAKKVSKKIYNKLPRSKKKELIKIIAEIDAQNFAQKIFDVLTLIKDSLTWNALKDSFSELGLWDAGVFALSFAAIFASAGVGFGIKMALFANSVYSLITAISECEAIVGK